MREINYTFDLYGKSYSYTYEISTLDYWTSVSSIIASLEDISISALIDYDDSEYDSLYDKNYDLIQQELANKYYSEALSSFQKSHEPNDNIYRMYGVSEKDFF